MISGSCLCGEVKYKAAEPIGNPSHCHCSMCRKLHGTPFGSYVRTSHVEFEQGKERITQFESSEGFMRCFCNTCGSILPEELKSEGYFFVPAGGLDGKLGVKASKHIFVGSKADWYEITDDLPQEEEYGVSGLKAIDQPDKSGAHEGHVGGSCLCGDVAFKYKTGSEKMMMACHCTRCRKVKGAAHAVNIFVPPDDFQWLHGEDKTVVYDLPAAERFGNSFCKRCGSSVPRKSENSPMYNVPAGALDDAPGIELKAHIFVGSKSDWFDIADSIPQHEEMPG